ncbi:bifunctional transcriptional activator/DNA repair enzyme AdaA [Bacillus solimangrovi]|uniref:AraC family transcriptional regulator n=1 Tax=Bacillus solimangrovi TaxID=1305675 RepID=A0A1E5LHV7_9BACI|nr:bifunctional transcriptional activator/DNA repair enzyme AdaA [Bacillus solimangrovi]OEH93655.1 AraC family transcriptional regulator [Bacillus solimangrovi]
MIIQRQKALEPIDCSLTEERWQAIVCNDASYDHNFYYGVKTTGIFCRPSCKSKEPKRQNVRIFSSAEMALSEAFRPCKRCKPNALRMPDEDWVVRITEYIDKHYVESLTLDLLADIHHGSPYHLQRTFKRIKGVSPMTYIQNVRISKAMELLTITELSIIEVSMEVGISSPTHFTTLFKKITGKTPTEYRKSNKKPN